MSARLAVLGGEPEVKGPIKPFTTIGEAEWENVSASLGRPLSGYMGGGRRGGYWVNRLEDKWAEHFRVKHAVVMNSATSGLMAAAFAIGLGPQDRFGCSPLTMSATAAAPMFTGAKPVFLDVEDQTFCMANMQTNLKANITTNLLGHPSQLQEMRRIADAGKFFLIEDNAQGPGAMENGQYAGTIGHVGIFSLNYHKHLSSGEGGICCTNDDGLADTMRDIRNHGECGNGRHLGLNLRMTETTAAIAVAQLQRVDEIVDGRINLAHSLTAHTKDCPHLTMPVARDGCRHVYYCWAVKTDLNRDAVVTALQAEGVPIRSGYSPLLYNMGAFANMRTNCPVAERIHEKELMLFEICSYDPTPEQVKQIGNAFLKVIDHVVATKTK